MINILADVCSDYLGGTGIPSKLAFIVHLAVRIIQIFVPIALIIWGMFDLGKAIMAQKEEEIKKGQNTFIKRLIAAVIVFFIVTIVHLTVNLFAGNDDDGSDSESLWGCVKDVITCKSASDCKSEKH